MPSLFDEEEEAPLKVHALAHYPSWDFKTTKWRDDDHRAFFFAHAIKDDIDRIGKKYATFNIGPNGAPVTVNKTNYTRLQKVFAVRAAKITKNAGLDTPVFIPIPNRNALSDATEFKSARLAKMVAEAYGPPAIAFTGLRFKELVPKEAGHRQHVSRLIANLILISAVPAGQIVLVDDIYTLGQHVEAARSLLPRAPSLVVVAAKTTKVPELKMLRQFEFNHEVR